MTVLCHSAYDLLIVGGGINGAGIARDAAGRGLKVALVERGDLANATSSASSKLIHGGLRYLEHHAYRLVREALGERDVLLGIAPHIIWPMRFVLPHVGALRPVWMIRAGLWLYDHLGWNPRRRSVLPKSHSVSLPGSAYGAGLRPDLKTGFVYSDCWVDDARLVVLNARGAADLGADVLTGTTFTGARHRDGLWQARLTSSDGGARDVAARILVNAAGPWVREVLGGALGVNNTPGVRLIKGSHIVVPSLYQGDHAYILQNDDRRVIFVMPYEERFSLIGTTDVPFAGDPASAAASEDEVAYLCRAVNRYLARPIAAADVVWTYAGVRPLFDDGSANASEVTRDYVLHLDGAPGAPVLSVFGGKITTYRRLAEHALDKLAPHLPGLKPSWTGGTPLPGGDLPNGDFDPFVAAQARAAPWLPAAHLRALARRHGTRMTRIIGDARTLADLGPHFGAGLYGREVELMIREEWAREPDDILFRRSKLGLHLDAAGRTALADFMARARVA
jgi:glycerol-3-phosphate dehydrogenase